MKIADFGMSRDMDVSGLSARARTTPTHTWDRLLSQEWPSHAADSVGFAYILRNSSHVAGGWLQSLSSRASFRSAATSGRLAW